MAGVPHSQRAYKNTIYKKLTITEVNTEKFYVEGIDTLGSPLRVDWTMHYPIVQVPRVQEEWIISYFDSVWKLLFKVESGNETTLVSKMDPGDVRIEGEKIWINGTVYLNEKPYAPRETVYNEVPSGLIDGSNRLYFTKVPYFANTLRVYLNGLRVISFTEYDGTGFEMNAAPTVGQTLFVDYEYDPYPLRVGGLSQIGGEAI